MFLRLFLAFNPLWLFCAPVQAQGQRVLRDYCRTSPYTHRHSPHPIRQRCAPSLPEPVELSVDMAADLGASPAYPVKPMRNCWREKQQTNLQRRHRHRRYGSGFAVQHQHDLFGPNFPLFLSMRAISTPLKTWPNKVQSVASRTFPPVYELLDLLHHLYPKATELHLIDDGLPHRRALYDLVVRASEARHFTPITHSLTQRTWQNWVLSLPSHTTSPSFLFRLSLIVRTSAC